jgi:hypothetical protein
MFTDDLELSIANSFDVEFDISDKSNKTAELIKNYVLKNTLLYENKNKFQPNWLGYEIVNEKINIYLEYYLKSNTKSFTINVTSLFDNFKDQKHVIHWKNNIKSEKVILSANNRFTILVL